MDALWGNIAFLGGVSECVVFRGFRLAREVDKFVGFSVVFLREFFG